MLIYKTTVKIREPKTMTYMKDTSYFTCAEGHSFKGTLLEL